MLFFSVVFPHYNVVEADDWVIHLYPEVSRLLISLIRLVSDRNSESLQLFHL